MPLMLPAHRGAMVLVMLYILAGLYLGNEYYKRELYNLRRGYLTRGDLTPVPGLDSPWAYIWSAKNDR